MGGVDTPSPGVTITDVREGGAAGNDGFLQVYNYIDTPHIIQSPSSPVQTIKPWLYTFLPASAPLPSLNS